MEPKAAVGWVAFLAGTCATLWLALSWPKIAELHRCDDAIREQLKAPATYRRISPSVWEVANSYVSKIEYDAQNSFGVPIRGRGVCIAGDHSATWLESPNAN